MCGPAQCSDCGKKSYSGCGKHLDAIFKGVPKDQICKCGPGGQPKPQ